MRRAQCDQTDHPNHSAVSLWDRNRFVCDGSAAAAAWTLCGARFAWRRGASRSLHHALAYSCCRPRTRPCPCPDQFFLYVQFTYIVFRGSDGVVCECEDPSTLSYVALWCPFITLSFRLSFDPCFLRHPLSATHIQYQSNILII